MESLAPAAGHLLVAAATLRDPNFSRSLVLLLDADADGALGVILNRPSRTGVGEVLGPWKDVVGAPGVLFEGGPVATNAALALARLGSGTDRPLGWRSVFADTGLVDLDTPVELVDRGFVGMRIYAGYAGWGAGQLEAEIAEGAWYVVPARPEDVFSPDPAGLWRRVLRRQRGELAMLATLPDDPALN